MWRITPQHTWKRCSRPGMGLACLALILLCALPAWLAAQEGRFEVRSANSRLANGVYYAYAHIDYRLSEEALEALENGVTLTIQVQIELIRVRRFWLDGTLATLHQDYELSYQPLSERYIVKNINSGNQASYVTLFSALNNLGRIVDLPVIDAALLEPDRRYELRLRAVLDQETLPGPLRLLAFWRAGFSLESDWYRWKLSD